MPIFTTLPPLSLYLHLPWCVKKCPYCDFNSHALKDTLPEEQYIARLLQELEHYLPLIDNRPVISIFFGGGTPSLFSAQGIAAILRGIRAQLTLSSEAEITLEANPGTFEQAKFADFYQAGINRLSIGIQSLQDDKLQTLGRIHDRANALRALTIAHQAGFTNFNVDLMYGLPQQSLADALADIETALSYSPSHLSWYQLTIEPNTLFHHQPPPLPQDEKIWEMQLAGQTLLAKAGFPQYEISAYAPPALHCRHNRNYWEFGDYLGLGAGAHSKITTANQVLRFSQVKHPRLYLETNSCPPRTVIHDADLIFEFMLNALRLTAGVSEELFEKHTGLKLECIAATIATAKQRGLWCSAEKSIGASPHGLRFLNDLMMLFLPPA